MERSGYSAAVSSHSVAARLSSDSISSRRGSETDRQSGGNVQRSVVTHVDAAGTNPLSALSVGNIPLSHVPHATSGKPPPLNMTTLYLGLCCLKSVCRL